jgi:hypothetical protein
LFLFVFLAPAAEGPLEGLGDARVVEVSTFPSSSQRRVKPFQIAVHARLLTPLSLIDMGVVAPPFFVVRGLSGDLSKWN